MWSSIFKKKPGRLQSSLTAKLLAGIDYIQRRWAAYMNRKTAHLSLKQKKVYFVSFCVFFAFANGCVLYRSLTLKPTRPPAVTPAVRTHTITVPKEREAVLTSEERTALKALRHRLDSLAQTPEGKQQLNAFLSAHPGFEDSLRKAEELIR